MDKKVKSPLKMERPRGHGPFDCKRSGQGAPGALRAPNQDAAQARAAERQDGNADLPRRRRTRKNRPPRKTFCDEHIERRGQRGLRGDQLPSDCLDWDGSEQMSPLQREEYYARRSDFGKGWYTQALNGMDLTDLVRETGDQYLGLIEGVPAKRMAEIAAAERISVPAVSKRLAPVQEGLDRLTGEHVPLRTHQAAIRLLDE